MKKIMILVSAIMMVANMSAQTINENSVDSVLEETLPNVDFFANSIEETAEFTATQLNVPARIRFIEGEKYGVRVSSNNSELVKTISCNVQNGVLSVNYKHDMDLEQYNDLSVVITIVTPQMPKVKVGRDLTYVMK